MKYFFIGGASDPEMRMMRSIISEAGMTFAFATKDGQPCHRGNAYKADSIKVPEGQRLVVIECEPANIGEFPDVVRIDHHQPRDPGFYMGPENYWEGASVGQLHHLLGIEPTPSAKLMAAMDHCFPAAIMGQCPGVSPTDVEKLKIEEIAQAMRVEKKDVSLVIAQFRDSLKAAPKVVIGKQCVNLLLSQHMGEGYSLKMLAWQVAIAVEGQAALVRLRDGPGEPDKIILSGNVTPETIKVFLEEWAPANNLVGIYAVPSRGYACGYEK